MYQAVQHYGQCYGLFGEGDLSGPFFCGMSWVMTLPQFSIVLHSPTSTSVHIEVAMKFSGQSGMILEFDNAQGLARNVTGFDCSWISRFKEEDERSDAFTVCFSLPSTIDPLLIHKQTLFPNWCASTSQYIVNKNHRNSAKL